MKTYWYTLDVNPVPWRVGPVGAARNGTTGKMKGYVGQDQELKTYQEAVRAELLNQEHVLVEGPFKLDVYFWRNQAEYATDRRAKGARNQVADGTNMYKATEDACQKILYPNDQLNVNGTWHIIEQGPDAPSKVIIALSTLSATHKDDVLQQIPDEVYAAAFPSASEQLALALGAPNTRIDGGDWHGDEPEVF